MNCKFCGSKKVKAIKLIKSPFCKDMNYFLYDCEVCLSRFFDINQYNFSIENFYNKIAKNRKNFSIIFTRNKYWEYQKNLALKLLGKKPSSILDIGCRTGDYLMHFDNDIIKEGVELSKIYAAIAKKRKLKIYNDLLEKIEFNQKYDIVSAFAILEHLVDPLNFLVKVKSLIKKNGLLIIMIPTYECFKEKILNLLNIRWHMYSPPEHLNFLSKKFLDSFLIQNNFEIIKRYYTSGGMINPFRKIPICNRIFERIMNLIDNFLLSRIPFFDHMYSYYLMR